MELTLGKVIFYSFLILVIIVAIASRARIQKGWLAAKVFFREVRIEMQRVIWPTRNDVIANTTVVLVAVISLTLIITAWDSVLSWVLRMILPGKGV